MQREDKKTEDTIAAVGTKLGFDRIRIQNEQLCTTPGAVEKLRDETFTRNAAEVTRRLRLADQMRLAISMESGFPTGDYHDIAEIAAKAAIEGAFLDTPEVALLRSALQLVRELEAFFRRLDATAYSDLKALGEGMDGMPDIAMRIDRLIDQYGEVRDNASPELADIRRAIREREGKSAKLLQKVLSQAQSAGIVDADATLSIRDGRPVIPVSAANKRKLSGFIHDESATGKTVYIEPVEVVEINNELRELEYAERREIVRLLTEFTENLRPDLPDLRRQGDYLVTMDMIRAKARFALANGCVMPIVSDDGTLELRQARHPLLQQTLRREGRELVPLDMKLTRAKHILVISGPNAGGKSVCLKTVGLIQLMFQSGMPVPLLENSQLPLFDDIYIDIGDQQSIENDLSTYSSHLLNMKTMLQNAGRDSLILIDEFGSGTEPVIGGAMAEAMLERFEAKGCYGVITTHYSNLKYYAANAEGVVNGAMTFDVQNIQPLFRLEMGIPGSSFAIEIARKTGVSEDIIRSASEKAGSDHVNIERQLREIARDRRYWEQKRDRIRVADRRVEDLEKKYGELLSTLKEQRAHIIKEAKTEASRITEEANRQIEGAIKVIRESQAEKELTKLAREELDTFRRSLDRAESEKDEKIEREMERLAERQRRREERKDKRGEKTAVEKRAPEPELPPEPVAGSKVRMEGQDMVGEVQSVKGKKAVVAFGQILTTVEKERLTVVSNSEFKKQARRTSPTISVSTDISQRKLDFKRNIDVRGMRAAEALEKVEDFIDDAIMVGVPEVRILHGKGTGALKEEIRRYLRAFDLVVSAEDEHVDLGGAGITVVKLDL